MSDSEDKKKPEPQPTSAGGPPRPPKKTARGLEDEPPDPKKQLSAAERAEVLRWLEEDLRKKTE